VNMSSPIDPRRSHVGQRGDRAVHLHACPYRSTSGSAAASTQKGPWRSHSRLEKTSDLAPSAAKVCRWQIPERISGTQ
jgi:hypothetical protein